MPRTFRRALTAAVDRRGLHAGDACRRYPGRCRAAVPARATCCSTRRGTAKRSQAYRPGDRGRRAGAGAHARARARCARRSASRSSASARAEAERLRQRRAADAEALTLYGDALWSAGLFDESDRAYRDALGLSPDSSRARFGMARSLATRNRLDEALDEALAAVGDCAARRRDPRRRSATSTSG